MAIEAVTGRLFGLAVRLGLRYGSPVVTWLRAHPFVLPCAGAVAIGWYFAFVTLRHTPSMGFPLDDSYIYLTYAKQFGRAQPFTYFPGGGYSAGSTSVLWPMVLAPFWTCGARGHAFVWVSYGLCTVFYAAVAVGACQLVRTITGRVIPGLLASLMVLAIAPFAWCALSGMEVALASALIIAAFVLLARTKTARPSKVLVTCLAATALSRPEAMVLVGAIIFLKVVQRLFNRDLRGAAWWLSPLIPAALWLVANRLLAGNFLPNTGVAKSHFYLPGFDWTYWKDTVEALRKKLNLGLYHDPQSPLVWPRIINWLQLIGSIRILLWARREQQAVVGVMIVAAPPLWMFLVLASSGLWTLQNYRYIAPALPLIMIIVGCALAPPRWLPRSIERFEPLIRRIWLGLAAALVLVFVRISLSNLRSDANLFAQGVMDTNTQVVAIGEYVHLKLPQASVMFHDAGAIAYYGDGRVYDLVGLVTNRQASVSNNGPGARFELLESLPPEQRPTHFAYYPSWMGSPDWFGAVVLETPLRPGFDRRRLVGDQNMELIVANWDHVHTGERPLEEHVGWSVVDRVDIADLTSEQAHDWIGRMGRRHFGDPTARWSMVERQTVRVGLVIDGGRTIRGGSEQFAVTIDPTKPTRVMIRTGGQKTYSFQEAITAPVTVRLFADDNPVGQIRIAPPEGPFSELTFDLPANVAKTSRVELRTDSTGPYRAFHWFVLQPE